MSKGNKLIDKMIKRRNLLKRILIFPKVMYGSYKILRKYNSKKESLKVAYCLSFLLFNNNLSRRRL